MIKGIRVVYRARIAAAHAAHRSLYIAPVDHNPEHAMKGMDQKKTEKKKPEKSLKEKRAAKKEKKAGK